MIGGKVVSIAEKIELSREVWDNKDDNWDGDKIEIRDSGCSLPANLMFKITNEFVNRYFFPPNEMLNK